MKEYTADELNQLYSDADLCDREIFAEMRSNLLLIAGDHYTKKGSKFWNRIRDDKSINEEQKLRLTKNHIQKIVKLYSNQIISSAPGVTVGPANQKELQDQKAAELNQSVWEYGKQINDFDEKVSDWADDFTGIGECATKIFFNPSAGSFKGYAQDTDQQGNPLYLDRNGQTTLSPLNEMGQQNELKPSDRAVFRGKPEFEKLYGFNLLRSPSARDMGSSPYLIIRKMAAIKDVKGMLDKPTEDQLKAVQKSEDQTFLVFEAEKASYRSSNEECLYKEIYFRPCVDYPKGYFYHWVNSEILFKGELPFGIFPIIVEAYEKIQTTPRGRGPVKTMRPYQVEINRAASKMAEHQITLGDDKLIMMKGSTMSQSASFPGIRGIEVSGAPPTILNGRDGSQYLAYMQSQVDELYQVMMVNEIMVEREGQLDPYALLFRAASQKQKFSRNIKRFERYLKKVCETYLELQRNYIDDDELIPAIGRREWVNVKEFRNSEKLCYQIKVEPQSEDVESKLGKQIVLNHALQYVGQKLDKEDIGKIMRAMPYGNFEESFSDLTLDPDSATDMILALDRGELPKINKYDNKPYMIKKLSSRTRKKDYELLSPRIKLTYDLYIEKYDQLIIQEKNALQAAEADFIPTSGALIGCDFWISDPNDPTKTRRAKLPYEAVNWLVNRLEQQGSSLQQLEQVPQAALAEMSGRYLAQKSSTRPGGKGLPMGSGQGAEGVVNGQYGDESSHGFDPRTIGAGTSPGAAIPNVT